MNNRVFLLGATGYIGQQVVKQLLIAGYQVDALLRNPEKAPLLDAQVNIIQGDLLKPETWLKHLENKAAIINTAFPSHGDSWADGVQLEKKLLQEIIQHIQDQPCKLILSNGSAFLGDSGENRLDENTPIQASHPASIRGYSIEEIRNKSTDTLAIIELRIASFVYGQGGSVFLPILLDAAKKHEKSIYVGEGNFRTSTVYVEAAARAYVQALRYGQGGEVYHITSDEEPSTKQIAQAIALAAGNNHPTLSVSPKESLQYVDPFTSLFLQQNNRLDNQKARRELHWSGHSEVSLFYDVAYGSYSI